MGVEFRRQLRCLIDEAERDVKLTRQIVEGSSQRRTAVGAGPTGHVEAPLEERALGGLGLFLVQQMMDGVEYQRRAGCNVVTLTKNTADEGAGGASISADEVIIEESSE